MKKLRNSSISRIGKEFALSTADLRRIMREFRSEMAKGLAGGKSSLKMIPTYVDKPTGREKGDFIALDLGGTNFRILEIALKGGGRTGDPRIMKFVLQKRHVNGQGSELFDFIAGCMRKFLDKYKITDDKLDLGFTFSFPVNQTAVASGTLVCWTKDFSAKGVVGQDVVALLVRAFRKKGVDLVNVSALVNDTVGTLVAKAYQDTDCDIGIILGTGTNACYRESLSGIRKWRGPSTKSGKMLVNTEWGNFNKLKLNRYDTFLDAHSENKGYQILEKAVSGMYLGEIARLVLVNLVKDGMLFGEMGSKVFKNAAGGTKLFRSEYASEILGDRSAGLAATGRILASLGVRKTSTEERRVVRDVCAIVRRRAARIATAALGAVILEMDGRLVRRHTAAIDGSVYEKMPGFAADMRAALVELFGSRASRIKLTLAKDGSGKGAAIVAAVAAGENRDSAHFSCGESVGKMGAVPIIKS